LVPLIIAVGLLNVCLGFAVAFYLGYGPPGLREAWDALAAGPREPHAETPTAPLVGQPPPEPVAVTIENPQA
jgi:hypothetical protein